MILKTADRRTNDVTELHRLLARVGLEPKTRAALERELINIQAGVRAEDSAAYELGFYYGATEKWAVIHDLRLQHQGRVAQIDHLLIDRVLNVWVLETKSFHEGLGINEYGECVQFFRGNPHGIASPLEQNRKHCAVLAQVFNEGLVALPTRLGFTVQPTIASLVLVSATARISRPRNPVAGADTVLKMDQLKSRIDHDREVNVLKAISTQTLREIGTRLAALHTPPTWNWAARFGLSDQPASLPPLSEGEPAASPGAPPQASASGSTRQWACHRCHAPVELRVARFCWFNKPRFGGQVYCQACQPGIPRAS